MDSKSRSRYEFHLSLMARGARGARDVLLVEGKEEEAHEFAMLAMWLRSEFERSAGGKQPLKGQTSLFRSDPEPSG